MPSPGWEEFRAKEVDGPWQVARALSASTPVLLPGRCMGPDEDLTGSFLDPGSVVHSFWKGSH